MKKLITYLFAVGLIFSLANECYAQNKNVKKTKVKAKTQVQTKKTTVTSPFIGIYESGSAFEGEMFLSFKTESGSTVGVYIQTPATFEGGFRFLDGTMTNEALVGKKFRISFENDERIAENGKKQSVYRLTRAIGFYEGILTAANGTSLNKVSLLFKDVNAPVLFINQEKFSDDKQILLTLPDGLNYDYADKKISIFYEADDDDNFFVRDFQLSKK
jgi:hypothetical protein